MCALTVKDLASRYHASFEATARRLVEKSFQPCLLAVFKEEQGRQAIDVTVTAKWGVRYSISSPSFRTKYFDKLTANVPDDIVAALTQGGLDIAKSEVIEVQVDRPAQEASPFRAEFFSNSDNIFCLLTPMPS